MLTKPFKPLALAFLVNLIISVEDKIKYISMTKYISIFRTSDYALSRRPLAITSNAHGHCAFTGNPDSATTNQNARSIFALYNKLVCVRFWTFEPQVKFQSEMHLTDLLSKLCKVLPLLKV